MKCKDCMYCMPNKNKGWPSTCVNAKLAEEMGQDDETRDDMLIYSYCEGGGFLVGPEFGCVHFQQHEDIDEDYGDLYSSDGQYDTEGES